MLQQTTVAAVGPYFERFLSRFPTVETLAAAPEDEVLRHWAGLGYYARARNLLRCARVVVSRGGFPRDPAGLRALPGIGEYTAAAIASIAFGVPAVAVDGNVERVTARILAIERPLPGSRPQLRDAARRLGADPDARSRPADFTQALFDLGATVCTARTPACGACPWREFCQAHAAGIAGELPRKSAKPARPVRFGAHFWLEDADRAVLLRRRPARGLLGGMLELPGTAWRPEPWETAEAVGQAPQPAAWRLAGRVRQIFTHFALFLDVYRAEVARIDSPGLLRGSDALNSEALPTVMRRCIQIAKQ